MRAVLGALAVSALLGASTVAQRVPAAPEELFHLYQQRQYDAVDERLAALPSFKAFAKEMATAGRTWPLRARAAFQLEAAASAYAASIHMQQRFAADTGTVPYRQVRTADRQRLVETRFETWVAARAMFEAACESVRTLPADDPFARDWHLAALALLQGVGDPNWLGPSRGSADMRSHIRHLKGRVEPGRLLLAEALTHEEEVWQLLSIDLPTAAGGRVFGDNILVTQLHRRLRESMSDALSLLTAAAQHPQFASEAALRKAALLHLRSKDDDLDAALAILRGLATGRSQVEHHAYLVHLFLGRVQEQRGNRAEAEAAYRRASEIMPSAQAARLSLAALAYLRGDGNFAEAAAEHLLDHPLESPDPWTLFTRGEFAQWPLRLAQVRNGIATN